MDGVCVVCGWRTYAGCASVDLGGGVPCALRVRVGRALWCAGRSALTFMHQLVVGLRGLRANSLRGGKRNTFLVELIIITIFW